MDYEPVYRCLLEVFPQIDSRLLKAVAIEHSKDADAAVYDILTEVIPYLAGPSNAKNSSARVDQAETVVECSEDAASPRHGSLHAGSLDPKCSAVVDLVNVNCTNGALQANLHGLEKELYEDEIDGVVGHDQAPIAVSPSSKNGKNSFNDRLTRPGAVANRKGFDVDEYIDFSLLEPRSSVSDLTPLSVSVKTVDATKCDLQSQDRAPLAVSPPSMNGKDSFNARLTKPDSVAKECVVSNGESFDIDGFIDFALLEPGSFVADLTPSISVKTADDTKCDLQSQDLAPLAVSPPSMNGKDSFNARLTKPDSVAKECVVSNGESFDIDGFIDFALLEPGSFVADLTPSISVKTADATKCDLQSQELHLQEINSFSPLTSKNDYYFIETGSSDGAFESNGTPVHSGQICSTDFLEEIIEDAKNNKKALFSVMESVMHMMKEVEFQEKAAELAKEEASMGGLDILAKVEDLKQMLAHAQETNGMHAGEVYGEKAILATEARELQSRLLCLSDERDNSLATLDEMRQTLEARLVAAQESKKAAELDKLGKEQTARDALAEQEAIMEKVVQESKLLEQEAEENSKLQEFLVDRGRIVDALQGEISVICQDVRLLKEKFDQRVPLNMSVSSSQTTCKLASSGSSLKSMTSVLDHKERLEEESLASLVGVVPKQSVEDDLVKSNNTELEDGWDIFDKDEELLM